MLNNFLVTLLSVSITSMILSTALPDKYMHTYICELAIPWALHKFSGMCAGWCTATLPKLSLATGVLQAG